MGGGLKGRAGKATGEGLPVWLVTGASQGIGQNVAEAAARSGALVVAGSRNPGSVTEWAQAAGLASSVTAVALDIAAEPAVQETVTAIVDRFGGIDVLVNNAGYLLYGGVEELSAEEVRRSFEVNVFGLLTVTRQVLPVMRRQRSGRIINMSSISANVTSPGTGLYSATKAAVLMLSEALDAEGHELGIRTTAVCPGGVRTDFLDPSSARRAGNPIAEYSAVHLMEQQLSGINHAQGGDPRKVAEAIVELAQMPDPPSRLYLGEDAIRSIRRKARDVLESLDLHHSLSESTTDHRGLR